MLITPRKHSESLANLQRDPRVAITIDEEQGRYRKVLFEGRAEVLYKVGEDRNGATFTGGLRAGMSMRPRPIIT